MTVSLYSSSLWVVTAGTCTEVSHRPLIGDTVSDTVSCPTTDGSLYPYASKDAVRVTLPPSRQ